MHFFNFKNYKKIKLALFFIIIIITGIIITIFMEYRSLFNKSAKIISQLSEGATISLGKIHQVSTKNGEEEWMLDADSANYINNKKQAVLNSLEVVFFLKNNKKVFLKADEGILHTELKDIEVKGNVIVKNQDYRIDTKRLKYINKTQTITSKVPVKISGDSLFFAADSMLIDLGSNKAYLEGNVKGSLGEFVF